MWQVRKITGHVFLVKIPNNRFWGTLPLQTFLPPKTHSCGKNNFSEFKTWARHLGTPNERRCIFTWQEKHLKPPVWSQIWDPKNHPETDLFLVEIWQLLQGLFIDKTLLKTNVTDWKIPMFNRKYIFIHGGVSTVVLGSIYTSTCKSTRCRWTLCIDIVYIYIYICLKRYKNIYLYNIYIYVTYQTKTSAKYRSMVWASYWGLHEHFVCPVKRGGWLTVGPPRWRHINPHFPVPKEKWTCV